MLDVSAAQSLTADFAIAPPSVNGTLHTPPPLRPGSPEPPQASSAIHFAPTGVRGSDGRRSHNVPGKAETTGAESLLAVGAKPPRRRRNADVRTREHLTEREVDQLCKAARADGRRTGHRDATMILLAFRHALRVSELVNLRWSDADLKTAMLQVRRVKHSVSGAHPIEGDELRALRKLRAADPESTFMFTTERGGPMSAAGFRKMLARLTVGIANLGALKVHPHALRHACGYAMVNKGVDTRTLQAYMGHAQITNTVRYTALEAGRFKGLWRK
jgi:integrase